MYISVVILFSFLTSGVIPEVKIIDQDVEISLNAYLDSLSTKIGDQRIPYHLLVRKESEGTNTTVYIESSIFLSPFLGNLPDKYSKWGDRLVFWYDGKRSKGINGKDEEFANQFKGKLIDNRESKEIDFENLDLQFIGPYQFRLVNHIIVSAKKVCSGFPDKKFYSNGYLYDKNGNARFSKGAYNVCSLDKPFFYTEDYYDPWEYVRVNSGIPYEFFQLKLTFYLTIDENGKVINAELDGRDRNIIDDQNRKRLIETMLHMPRWNPGTINGKKVKYRVSMGL